MSEHTPELVHIPEQCQCDPCTLPRANGGRCPSFDTEFENGVRSSHCLACAFCCFDEEI